MSSLALRKIHASLFATLAAAVGCGGDDAPASDAGNAAYDGAVGDGGADDAASADGAVECADCDPVSVTFRTQSAQQPVDCEHTISLGGHDVKFTDIRYYVSEVALLRADGSSTPLVLDTQTAAPGKPAYQGQQVALLDFEDGGGACQNGDAAMNDTIVGRAKPGTYTGIAFTLGVPEALNHLNVVAVEAPLNVMSMYWFWLSGYMFTALDFQITDVTDPGSDSFRVHLGSGGCSGSPSKGTVSCARPNRARITLTDFDASKNAVVLDLDALVKGRDLAVAGDSVPGCMSDLGDPDCDQVLENLAVDPTTGAPTGGAQTAFSVDLK